MVCWLHVVWHVGFQNGVGNSVEILASRNRSVVTLRIRDENGYFTRHGVVAKDFMV